MIFEGCIVCLSNSMHRILSLRNVNSVSAPINACGDGLKIKFRVSQVRALTARLRWACSVPSVADQALQSGFH